MDLKEEQILGAAVQSHWYYRAKAAMLLRHLRGVPVRRVLDVGAGAGFFALHLLRHTDAACACCVDTSYALEQEALVAGKPVLFRRSLQHSDADLVLLMDVLEHVDDDRALLAEVVAKVPSGALFVITVPAFQALWSGHDVFLGHRRRYRLRELQTLVAEVGLQRLGGFYFYGLLFPLAALTRWTSRLNRAGNEAPRSQLRRHHPLINELLAGICRLELGLHRHNRLAGLSAVYLARKP